jgi:Tfp pilus assembly protein PilN
MMNINLLSWRSCVREKKNQYLRWSLIGGILFVIMFFYLLHCLLQQCSEKQKVKIHYLQLQLKALSLQSCAVKELNRQCQQFQSALQLFKRMEVNQIVSLELFSKIIKMTPVDITFSGLMRKDQKVVFKGLALSAVSLSKFVDIFRGNKYLHAGQFEEITNPSQDTQSRFQFKITQNVGCLIKE